MKILYVIVGGPSKYYAHRDKAGLNAINYYISTGPSKTSFYELIADTHTWVVIDGIEYPGWYDYTSLLEIASFSANSSEAYILNINTIHDVELFTREQRHFIQYLFNEQL